MEQTTGSRSSLIIIFILFATFFFGGGFFIGKDYQTIAPGIPLKLDKVSEVYQTLQKDFIFKEEIEAEKLEYGAVKGFVDAVGDPYTYFLTPKEYKDFEEIINGSFEGIGAEIGLNEQKQIVIIAPLEGTPAKKAGLKPQDLLLQIEDRVLAGLTLDEAVALIRGPKRTSVTLTIKREGLPEPIKISIIRDLIEIPILRSKLIEEEKVAYLQLFNFNEKAGNAFKEAAQKVLISGAQAVILDLRGNPGGILQEAVEIGGWFIEKGVVVASEKFADGSVREYKSAGPAKLKGFPLVLLIDKGSASASEILAGALQFYNKVKLVGEKTFGKGTVQILEQFSDGSALRVTVSQWLLPNGKSIDKEGLTPDILIKKAGVNEEEDEQLQKAIELLK